MVHKRKQKLYSDTIKSYRKGDIEIEVGWIMQSSGKKQWYVSTTDHKTRREHPMDLAGDILLQPNKSRALKNFELNAERMKLK